MKKSELATVIREEFLALLKEEEIQVGKVKVEKDKLKKATEKAEKGDSDELATIMALGGVVEEEMDDDEMDKAATKGAKGKDAKGVTAQATAALKAQQKKKALKAFMDKMKDAGIVSDSNKVLDARKYKDEFAKFKASL